MVKLLDLHFLELAFVSSGWYFNFWCSVEIKAKMEHKERKMPLVPVEWGIREGIRLVAPLSRITGAITGGAGWELGVELEVIVLL